MDRNHVIKNANGQPRFSFAITRDGYMLIRSHGELDTVFMAEVSDAKALRDWLSSNLSE
jgi:hypothetical protein